MRSAGENPTKAICLKRINLHWKSTWNPTSVAEQRKGENPQGVIYLSPTKKNGNTTLRWTLIMRAYKNIRLCLEMPWWWTRLRSSWSMSTQKPPPCDARIEPQRKNRLFWIKVSSCQFPPPTRSQPYQRENYQLSSMLAPTPPVVPDLPWVTSYDNKICHSTSMLTIVNSTLDESD